MAQKQLESSWVQHPMTNCWSKYLTLSLVCFCLWLGFCYSWWPLWRTESFRASLLKGVFFSMSQWLFGGCALRGGLKIWPGIGLGRWLGTWPWLFHGFSFLCILGGRSMINGWFGCRMNQNSGICEVGIWFFFFPLFCKVVAWKHGSKMYILVIVEWKELKSPCWVTYCGLPFELLPNFVTLGKNQIY